MFRDFGTKSESEETVDLPKEVCIHKSLAASDFASKRAIETSSYFHHNHTNHFNFGLTGFGADRMDEEVFPLPSQGQLIWDI